MPRNPSNVYSKPAGTTFTPNTVIESARVNEVIDDIVADLNLARPITAGGTGSSTAPGARTALGVDPSRTFVTKSDNYTALAADKAANIRFNGAYTLSLTAAATLGSGWYCYVQADGGNVVIDPNSTELVNGAATITLINGSSLVLWCTGSEFFTTDDWQTLATKLDIIQPTIDVASATTTDIGAVASENVRITGTTTITGLGTAPAGTLRSARFAGVLALTHNATSLILRGDANITTAAGDVGYFLSEGSGNWRMLGYSRNVSPIAIFTPPYESAQTSYANGSPYEFVHGLGRLPHVVQVWAVCTTAQSGVSIVGDWVQVATPEISNDGSSRGCMVRMNTTSVWVHVASAGLIGVNTTGAVVNALTASSFRLVVRAW